MNDIFDLELSLDDLAGVNIQDETAVQLEVIPAVFKAQEGNITEIIYLTTSVDTALLYNPELDTFSSYEYFTLPLGKEVKNQEVLERFELLPAVFMPEEDVINSIQKTFNNQFLRAMLEN